MFSCGNATSVECLFVSTVVSLSFRQIHQVKVLKKNILYEYFQKILFTPSAYTIKFLQISSQNSLPVGSYSSIKSYYRTFYIFSSANNS